VDLSHPFGDKCPLRPSFEDVKIERTHYMAKSSMLSQKVTTVMYFTCTTHADFPAHMVESTTYTYEIQPDKYNGTGVLVDIPKNNGSSSSLRTCKMPHPKLSRTTSSSYTPDGTNTGATVRSISLILRALEEKRVNGSYKKASNALVLISKPLIIISKETGSRSSENY
jgi:hypothetical protein